MTGFERFLLEIADSTNMAQDIKHIIGRIDTMLNSEVEGLSLMTIRDHLPKHSDDILREKGYILTIAQFKDACKHYLALDEKDFIRYNSVLKRLHRGYEAFVKSYEKGKIVNKTVSAEMQKHFTETMQSCYSNGSERKMPTDLSNRIHKMTIDMIEKLNDAWFKNATPADINKEFTTLLEIELLNDWHRGNLGMVIEKQLQEEKKRINSVDALVTHFRENKLPAEVEDRIKQAIIARLYADVDGLVINELSPLGSTISNLYNKRTKKDYTSTFSEIILNWQNNQLAPDASEQLRKCVESVIGGMKLELEKNLAQQFDQLAAHTFLEKLQKSLFPKNVIEVMHEYSLATAKSNLQLMSSGNDDGLSICKNTISSEVMTHLHDDWIKGGVTVKEAEYIHTEVFADLKELDDKIKQRVYFNDAMKNQQKDIADQQVQINNLNTANTEMKAQIAALQEIVAKLIPNAQQSAAVSANNTAKAAIVEEKSAQSFSGFGLFNK